MDLTQELNPVQLQAVLHKEGPALVLAGAGSGKTRIITFRIAQLIASGVHPSAILAVTFTNKAAQEMQERISHVLTEQSRLCYPTICTFHSLGARILRESIQHLGYSEQFVIYDEEDTQKLLKGCLQALNIQKETQIFKAVRSWISHLKNQLKSPQDVDLQDLPEAYRKAFPQLFSLYQERLKAANALDFDDLLFLPVQLFQHHPEVLQHYQNRWPYLLIDEYQDTNRAQYLFARLISNQNHNIFVVGDPDQSIYSWRGANIQNILNFAQDYPGSKIIRLEQNYRSRTHILNAANALIRHNSERLEKALWSERGEGERIALCIVESEQDEAHYVAGEIEKLHKLHAIPLNQIAIFYRTNFQSRVFEDVLLRRRIPYVIVGGISFYQRREIKDILSFLRMLLSDQDLISFERTVNLPKRGLGPTSIAKILSLATTQQVPILALCRQILEGTVGDIRLSATQRAGLTEYLALIDELRHLHQTAPLHILVGETITKSGYVSVLKEERETFEDRQANLSELVSKAYEWQQQTQTPSLDAFLEELALKSSLDEADLAPDKINLMTLHNGKGLEFLAVFLVGMEETLFPHVNSINDESAVEEERRLCYVGMTRARERLFLSAARGRFLWGGYRSMRPSRFLHEIPREHIAIKK